MSTPEVRRRRPYAARVPADVRREQLMDAALALLVREGYDALTVEAICREAGVTRPVLYGVYDGLGDLLGALLDRSQRRALDDLAAAVPPLDQLTDPDAFLVEAARRLLARVHAEPSHWRPILLAPSNVPAEVAERIARDRAEFLDQLTDLLRIGLPLRGGPMVDPRVAAHMALALLEYFGRLLLTDPDAVPPEQVLAAVETLLASLRP